MCPQNAASPRANLQEALQRWRTALIEKAASEVG